MRIEPLQELKDGIAEIGLPDQPELSGDQVNRSYLISVLILHFFNALAKKDLTAARNLVEVLEGCLSDIYPGNAEYLKARAEAEAEFKQAQQQIESVYTRDLDKTDNYTRAWARHTTRKFSALVVLMNKCGIYGKRKGGLVSSAKNGQEVIFDG